MLKPRKLTYDIQVKLLRFRSIDAPPVLHAIRVAKLSLLLGSFKSPSRCKKPSLDCITKTPFLGGVLCVVRHILL